MLKIFLFTLLLLTNITGKAMANYERAIFAGGCFWCMEPPFEKEDGVISVKSGYTAGDKKNPTYKQVSAGITSHTEGIEIVYDPKKISYQKLLDIFWKNIDPLVKNRQFCDVGAQYRSGIYYIGDEQKELALKSLENVKNKFLSKEIYTEIQEANEFYEAEEYHQDYYKKNPIRYKYYRYRCGRDERLRELWSE